MELFTAIVARRPAAHGVKPDESADHVNCKSGGALCFCKSDLGNYGKINAILGLRKEKQNKTVLQAVSFLRCHKGHLACLLLSPSTFYNIKINKASPVAERLKFKVAGLFKQKAKFLKTRELLSF